MQCCDTLLKSGLERWGFPQLDYEYLCVELQYKQKSYAHGTIFPKDNPVPVQSKDNSQIFGVIIYDFIPGNRKLLACHWEYSDNVQVTVRMQTVRENPRAVCSEDSIHHLGLEPWTVARTG